MAEGTYEFECMRAELLGVEKPDYDEFVKTHPPPTATQNTDLENDEEFLEIEKLQEADLTNESSKRIGGGLDELNSILQQTQKKIHRFRASCGSLTNLLKIKIGHGGSSTDSLEPNGTAGNSMPDTSPAQNSVDDGAAALNGSAPPKRLENQSANEDNGSAVSAGGSVSDRKSDLTRALDNHVDAFDSLIEKAEKAQLSMEYQNKEMKRFLKK